MSHLVKKWLAYRDTRRGTYEFRCRTRYAAVLTCLKHLGLQRGDTILDVGAGTAQFGQYLQDEGWDGEYIPVDAVIDGTDLETWLPPIQVDYIVCIEVVEHLNRPSRLISAMLWAARRGLVLTTPNSETVDVIACDPTHVSVIPAFALEAVGFTVERHTWFGVPQDSLLAWRQNA